MMAASLDLKTVVKHLVNGSLGANLCVVCLVTLSDDNCENIFTSICKKDEEYCIADVLREVCQLQSQYTDQYSICWDCLKSASTAYQFYLQAKRSYEILNFYTDQLSNNIEDLEITREDNKRLLCIPLPVYTPETPGFDYGFEGFGNKMDNVENETDCSKIEVNKVKDDEVILIVKDGDGAMTYNIENDLNDIVNSDESDDGNVLMIVNEKKRKKRDPMVYISCMHCPVRYRFLSKLKDHVKRVHNVDIYYCKICKLITDNKESYEEHILTHIGEYQCTQCNAKYRRQDSLLAHMKAHEEHEKYQQENMANGNICEICGVVLENEEALARHTAERHAQKYTCYYCGRMYKGQASFEAHINKHEAHFNKKPNNQQKSNPENPETKESNTSKRSICGVCGKSFVDERSLLWHQRLHDNERPFVCDICSRGFVSLNRRNQHATCAHSPPARRCPLCPALFHLRSMVNTHLKKVHLNKQQKRRHRVAKQTNVFWRTETVPIQELSVSIQNEVLEMQSAQDKDWNYLNTTSHGDSNKKSQDFNTNKSQNSNNKKYNKPSNPKQYTKQHVYTIDMDVQDLPNDIMSHDQDFELDNNEGHEFIS